MQTGFNNIGKPVKMERNTITTVGELHIGDRFYKASDKKRVVWEKVESEIKRTYYQTYKHFAITPGERFPVAMNKDSKVVFLINQNG